MVGWHSFPSFLREIVSVTKRELVIVILFIILREDKFLRPYLCSCVYYCFVFLAIFTIFIEFRLWSSILQSIEIVLVSSWYQLALFVGEVNLLVHGLYQISIQTAWRSHRKSASGSKTNETTKNVKEGRSRGRSSC